MADQMIDTAPYRCASGYRSESPVCEFGQEHVYEPRWTDEPSPADSGRES